MNRRTISGWVCLAVSLLGLSGCGYAGGGTTSGASGSAGGTGGGGGNQLPALNFAPRIDLSNAGNGASHVVLADFNHDGKLDIAVTSVNQFSISVFLNQGDGAFTPAIATPMQISGLPSGTGFATTVAGDFNDDGIPDLIVGPLVFLGNGDGTFHQEAIPLPNPMAGAFTMAIKTADFNGDGHLDLVRAGLQGFDLLMGNGDGTFSEGSQLPSISSPGNYDSAVVGDFNGDKKLDIVLCDSGVYMNGGNIFSRPGSLVFYAGNGDGTFRAPVLTETWNYAGALAAADFTGTGKLGILIISSVTTSSGNLGIVPGNGDGTFQNSAVISLPSSEYGVYAQAADLDLDGKADVLTANGNTGVLTLVQNSAIGRSPSDPGVHQFTIAPGLTDVAAGDLNGDGLPDVVVSNAATQLISVFLSKKQ